MLQIQLVTNTSYQPAEVLIPTRISIDLCGLVSARGVASPQAIFQIDAATRQQKRIQARSRSKIESKLLRVSISPLRAQLNWSAEHVRG